MRLQIIIDPARYSRPFKAALASFFPKALSLVLSSGRLLMKISRILKVQPTGTRLLTYAIDNFGAGILIRRGDDRTISFAKQQKAAPDNGRAIMAGN